MLYTNANAYTNITNIMAIMHMGDCLTIFPNRINLFGLQYMIFKHDATRWSKTGKCKKKRGFCENKLVSKILCFFLGQNKMLNKIKKSLEP